MAALNAGALSGTTGASAFFSAMSGMFGNRELIEGEGDASPAMALIPWGKGAVDTEEDSSSVISGISGNCVCSGVDAAVSSGWASDSGSGIFVGVDTASCSVNGIRSGEGEASPVMSVASGEGVSTGIKV